MTIALAIILHPTDGTVLIARRKADAHLPDVWEFPGGKRLPGEDPAVCAVREAREETGLDVTILEAWPVITHNYPDRDVVLHPFLCLAASGEARPLDSRAVVWAAPSDLGQYPFPEANGPLLERLTGRLGRGRCPNPARFTG